MRFKTALTLAQENPSILKTLHIIKLLDGKEELKIMANAPSQKDMQELARTALIDGEIKNESKALLQALAKGFDKTPNFDINKNFAHLATPGLFTLGHFAQTRQSPLAQSKVQLQKIADALDSTVKSSLKQSATNVNDNDVKPSGPSN